MVIIETHLFRKLIDQLMTDDELTQLQRALIEYPDRGVLIKQSGGLRKLRWSSGDGGKRGGLRIIYYWQSATDQVYLIFIYQKSVQKDLTHQQLSILRKLVEDWN
jgi:hypothetical protein